MAQQRQQAAINKQKRTTEYFANERTFLAWIGQVMVVEAKGRSNSETMNAIGYDAKVVGHHEPDFTAEKLRGAVRFPILAAISADGGRNYSSSVIQTDRILKVVNSKMMVME